MTLAEPRRRGAEAIRGTGREILNEDVRALEQPLENGRAGRVLEIERQRLLRPIQPDEIAGESLDPGVVAAGEIAAVRPFDLDHPRPEIGELPGGERSGHRLLHRYDGDVFQRQHCCLQYDRGSPRTCSAT